MIAQGGSIQPTEAQLEKAIRAKNFKMRMWVAIGGSSLAALAAGLPTEFFWTRLIVSVLIAGLFTTRQFLDDPYNPKA